MACTAGSAECVIHLGGPSRENPSCGDCVSTAKTTLHQANENSRRVNKDCQAQNHVVTLELLWFRGVEICKKGLQNPSRLDDAINKAAFRGNRHPYAGIFCKDPLIWYTCLISGACFITAINGKLG